MSRNAAILGIVGPNEPIRENATRSRGEGLCGAMPLIHPIRKGGASRSKGLRRGSSWRAPESRLGGLKLLEVSFGLWKSCTTNEGNRRIPSYVVGHKLIADISMVGRIVGTPYIQSYIVLV